MLARLSIRTSTVLTIVLIGIIASTLSWAAGNHFRRAALSAQVHSLSRIIEVASREVLRELEEHAITLGSTLNSANHLGREYRLYHQNHDGSRLSELLDDPFITGFPGYGEVELAKLRLYDLELRPEVESNEGLHALNFSLPHFLQQQAATRQGSERLKAIGGLWVSELGPIYSVLLPVGGLHIEGYLEVVFNPRFNLKRVSEITDMPVTIQTKEECEEAAREEEEELKMLHIGFILKGEDGKEAFHLIGHENIDRLEKDTLDTQLVTTVVFLTFIFLTLLFALLVLRRGLFTPLRHIMEGIEEYSHGNLETRIEVGGLKELRTLGNTFNDMLHRIHDDIDELERLSNSDGLTGLANRRYFESCLLHEWHNAIRHRTEISLLFVDIDYFKKYNDHYGHLKGDECLRQVAEVLKRVIKRHTDTTARYGGEEFVLLLPETGLEVALQLAEAVKAAIAEAQFEHAASEVKEIISLSIGLATMRPQRQNKPEELVERADQALYRAKEQGRDRIVVAEAEKTA